MRDRLATPVLLPVLAAGTILLTIFSFGYVLLEVQHTRQAWPVAVVVASAILLIASVLANQPKTAGWQAYAVTALPAAVILATGMYFLIRPGEETGGGAAGPALIQPPGPLSETATDNRFSVTAFRIVAGQQYQLSLTNSGQALHNWQLNGVTGASGQPVATMLLQAGQSETIQFTVPAPGTFDFLCTVHPTEMKGTVTALSEADAASAASATAGAGSPGPGQIVDIATDNKFSQVALQAAANQATSLTLENRGTALHNLRVQGVKGANGQDIVTKLLPGGQSETIQFTIAQPGSYDFLCDVHPVEMKGKLTVQ